MIPCSFVCKALVQYQDRFLILQRSDSKKHNPGGWDLAGGRAEVTDVSHQKGHAVLTNVIVREVSEEMGLSGLSYDLIAASSSRQKDMLVCRHLYHTQISTDKIFLSEEHKDYQRIDKESLLAFDWQTESLHYLLQQIAV